MSRNEALSLLAGQMHCPTDLPPEQLRATLERTFQRLIRCALRSGAGMPRLVKWARQRLQSQGGGQDALSADEAAPSLARQLCGLLLEQMEREPVHLPAALETVVGW
jgi:hypothetical protein